MVKKIKPKYTINNKNKLKHILLTGTTSIVAMVPIATSASYVVNKTSISFDGKLFSSKNSLLQYVKNNTKTLDSYVEGYNSQWKLSYGGKVETFSNTADLRRTLNDKYITQQLYRTNVDLTQYESADGRVLDTDIWNNICAASAESARVYQGANDVAYKTQKEAYDSYFSAKDAYYFNGIYFDNKEELKTYLLEQYLPNSSSSNSYNTIVLQGPNGVKSAPIDLTSSNAYNQIGNFVINNAKKVLSYTNSRTNQEYTITKNNMNSMLSDVNISDLDYIHVHSNQGQSRYVIDNDYTDSANLIGPYFYNGTLDVGAFTNKNMWKKVNGVTNSVYVQSKIDTMIGSFFSSIINDDSSLILSDAEETGKTPVLFRTILTDSDGNSCDELFLKKLKTLSPELYEAVNEANLTLLKGKKYNTFNKIPILYSFLMQRAISWGLGQDVVNLIIDYFTNVCNFIQDAIEMVVMDNSLLTSKDGKTKFNAVDFFQIGNPEYDLNTSTEYFLNQLKTNYPNLIAAMNSYISAQNNIAIMSGLIPYSAVDNSFLVEYKIFDNQTELDAIKTKLEIIYKVFSSLDYDSEMLPTYIKNSTRSDIKEIQSLSQDQWKDAFSKIKGENTGLDYSTLLSGIGAKNNQYYALARSMLDLEIKTFLSTGQIVKYGYLQKIYSENSNTDKLGPFIDLVTKNKDLDTYRVYMAVLVDKRMNTNIMNSQTMANPLAFARALSQVIILGLGSATLVGNSVSRIYGSNSSEAANFGSSLASNITSVSSEKQVSTLSKGWTSTPGEDTSTLSEPLSNPLYKLFVDADENVRNSSLKTRTVSTRGVVSINPNDPNVAKQVDLLKNSNSFRKPSVRTSALIKNYEKMSIATMDGLVASKDISKDNVKGLVEYFNGLNVKTVDNIPVACNPTDVAASKIAQSFDSIDGYVDNLTNNISTNIDINGTYKSQNTIILENKLNDKLSNKPVKENFATQKEFETALGQWNTDMRKIEAELSVSKIGDSGLLSYPLRKDFATDAEYNKSFQNWLNNYTKFSADLYQIDESKFKKLDNLNDYPLRSDFGSDTEFYRASEEYKAKYDKLMKEVVPDADISWVGGTKPNSSTNNGSSNGGSSNNSSSNGGSSNNGSSNDGSGAESNDTSKPGGGSSTSTTIDGVGDVSTDTNQRPNLVHPKREDFPDEESYRAAYLKWNNNYSDFLDSWFNDLPDNLKQDYLKNIGGYPQFKDYKTNFEFLEACEQWEAKYNQWVKDNLPANSHEWTIPENGGTTSGDGDSTTHKPGGDGDSTTHKPGGDGDSTTHKPGGDGDSTTHKPGGDGDSTTHKPSGDGDSTTHRPSIGGDSTTHRPGVDSETELASKKTFKEKLKNWWSGESKFAKIKDTITTVASYALEIFATAFAAMEIFFFVYDLLQVTKTQDFYEYTTADGTNFYWDGGLTVSKFMGLDVTQEKGIDDMKLLTPIQITLPQVEEYYYFNGVKYYDTTEMKKDQLTYIFNGGEFASSNKYFKVKYTFTTDIESNYAIKANSIDELINLVFKELGVEKKTDGSIDVEKFNKESELVSNAALSFGNGVIIGEKDNYQTQAENIVKNIRHTKIVQLPDTKSDGVSRGKASSFTFPGNYWDSLNKKVIYQDANQFTNYLVDNSANDLKNANTNGWINASDYVTSDANEAEKLSLQRLRETFENAFTLNSKSILANQQMKSFSEMSGDNFVKPIYTVQLPNSAPQYFVDESKATNYVLNMLNFQKITDNQKVRTYIYNGQTFYSEQALMNWVLAQIN